MATSSKYLASSRQETEIIRQLTLGDKAAMTLLYECYGMLLYRAILRLVKHPLLAEVALQEGFIDIWQTFHTYNAAHHSLFAWTLAICRDKALQERTSYKQYVSDATMRIVEP